MALTKFKIHFLPTKKAKRDTATKQNPKTIDAESRVDPQQKRKRTQARGLKRFHPTVAAPEMVAETATRKRRDPSAPPMVEGGIVTPSKANDTHKISDGAVATALPSGGAAMRTSTPTPVVALP